MTQEKLKALDGGRSQPSKTVPPEDNEQKNSSFLSHIFEALGEIKSELKHTAKTSDVEKTKGELSKDISEIKSELKHTAKTSDVEKMKGDLSGDIREIEGELKRVPSTFQLWIAIVTVVITISGIIFFIARYFSNAPQG